MHDTEDTIAAIATPLGRAALGTVRISGRNSRDIVSKVFIPRNQRIIVPFRPILGRIALSADKYIDEAVLMYFQKPESYTREDVVEITCHGNPLILDEMMKTLLRSGARLARPGEFTFRAFLNGRIDLVQADAINDLISADSIYQAELALQQLDGRLSESLREIKEKFLQLISLMEGNLDFSEEQHYNFISREQALERINEINTLLRNLLGTFERGRLIREGVQVALVGKPNVGKSSLFNAILGQNRAIVTAEPGTTRDYLRERILLGGCVVQLVDTAGVREADLEAEREGVRRSLQVIANAELILFVLDGSACLSAEDWELWKQVDGKECIVLNNKYDEKDFAMRSISGSTAAIPVSALTGAGIKDVLSRIEEFVEARVRYSSQDYFVSNLRHRDLLESGAKSVEKAEFSLREGWSEEFVLVDLHQALESVGEITGEITIEDIYSEIFSKFCIGK